MFTNALDVSLKALTSRPTRPAYYAPLAGTVFTLIACSACGAPQGLAMAKPPKISVRPSYHSPKSQTRAPSALKLVRSHTLARCHHSVLLDLLCTHLG